VTQALRFALPLAFVSWAGLSLYLSLVPSYLAAALHALNPWIGAGAVVAAQLTSLIVTFRLGNVDPERSGIAGAIASVAGIALLVVATSANLWPLIALATLLVGAGGGVASAAAFGIAGRIGRGQRARIFARMYVAAYVGYSLPALAVGVIAAHASFVAGFSAVTIALAVVTATLPWMRRAEPEPACPRQIPAAA
jgi:MFS family permease